MASLKKADLLGIEDLSAEEISLILDTAESFKEVSDREIKKVPILRGKTAINLFFESSTRTRSSFEIAQKRLSADTINFSVSGSSVSKGETLRDTSANLEAMKPDIVVMRHGSSGACRIVADTCDSPVVNAGDGTHEHPTQALLDAMTIREKKGRIKGLKVAIIGDLTHSRVMRSNVHLLSKMKAFPVVCGHPCLIPPGLEALGAKVTWSLDEAIDGADVVMMLRVQRERQTATIFSSTREYFRFFGLSCERLKRAKSDVIVMHPGPMNRGVEISSDVADGPISVILDQVTNGVAVRMAVLYLLLGGSVEENPA